MAGLKMGVFYTTLKRLPGITVSKEYPSTVTGGMNHAELLIDTTKFPLPNTTVFEYCELIGALTLEPAAVSRPSVNQQFITRPDTRYIQADGLEITAEAFGLLCTYETPCVVSYDEEGVYVKVFQLVATKENVVTSKETPVNQ